MDPKEIEDFPYIRTECPIERKSLYHAFSWATTPQGYEYWSERAEVGLCEKSKGIWLAAIDAQQKRAELGDGFYWAAVEGTREVYPYLQIGKYGHYITGQSKYRVRKGHLRRVDAPEDYPEPPAFGSWEQVLYKLSEANLELGHQKTLKNSLPPNLDFLQLKVSGIYSLDTVGGDASLVSIYKTYKDFSRGRTTTMKVGKALRYMFPELNDVELEAAVKSYLSNFEDRKYTLLVGRERKDFRTAYGDNLVVSRDPTTTRELKTLHNSCLRGLLVGEEGISPAEVYASGEFHIAWVRDEQRKLAGRVVVWDGGDEKPQAGPIYGSCTQSLKMLQGHLESIGAETYDSASWIGAKLLYLEVDGRVVGPYSDLEMGADIIGGGFLQIQSHGEYELCETEGFISGGVCCQDCGGTFDPSAEGSYVQDYGETCGCCLDSEYAYCEDVDGYLPLHDTIEVFSTYVCRGQTRHSSQRYSDEYSNAVFCDCVEEFWELCDTTYSEHSGWYIPKHLVSDYPEMFPSEEEEKEGDT